MRNIILSVAVSGAIIGGVVAVNTTVAKDRIRGDLDQERYQRMVTEEHLQKTRNTIKHLETELAGSRSKIQSVLEILSIGQLANTNLKTQVKDISRERQSLREEREIFIKRIAQLQEEAALQASQEQVANP